MPITEKQRKERMKYLGASDMAAILGVDPYKTAYDVWLEKTGQAGGFQGNKSTEAGTFFERAVLDWAETILGKIQRPRKQVKINVPETNIYCHLDGIVKETGNPVEAKTACLFGPSMEGYGDEGTDELPDRVLVQCQTLLAATERKICHVPVFIGRRGFVMYEVERDAVIIGVIINRAKEFWERNVMEKHEPDGQSPSMPFLENRKRETGAKVELTDQLVDEYNYYCTVVKEAEGMKEEAKVKLLTALGSGEIGVCSHGEVTYFETKKTTFDTSRFKAEHSDLYKAFAKESTSRTLRYKPFKRKEKV